MGGNLEPMHSPIPWCEKWVTFEKHVSHRRKWVTFGQMGRTEKFNHIWENGSHCENWVTPGKMGHRLENGLHCEKFLRCEKNVSKCEK